MLNSCKKMIFMLVILAGLTLSTACSSSATATSSTATVSQLSTINDVMQMLRQPTSVAQLKALRAKTYTQLYSEMLKSTTDSEFTIGGVKFSGLHTFVRNSLPLVVVKQVKYGAIGVELDLRDTSNQSTPSVAEVKQMLVDLAAAMRGQPASLALFPGGGSISGDARGASSGSRSGSSDSRSRGGGSDGALNPSATRSMQTKKNDDGSSTISYTDPKSGKSISIDVDADGNVVNTGTQADGKNALDTARENDRVATRPITDQATGQTSWKTMNNQEDALLTKFQQFIGGDARSDAYQAFNSSLLYSGV